MVQARFESDRSADAREPALLTLARRRDLPGRVQGLLHGVYSLCLRTWPKLLEATFSDFEQDLFKRA